MKKVCVVIGSRANYSACNPVMRAVRAHPELKLQTVLGATAVLHQFGNLERILEDDGFEVHAEYNMIVAGETPVSMAKSAGLGIIELSNVFQNLAPDVVLVVGDRFDILSPAVAASYMNIPLAHIMGGEVSGTIDESIRHAVTKLACLHFPANEDARRRIISMGEDPDSVFCVGCPRIDLVAEILATDNPAEPFDSETFFATYKGVGASFDIHNGSFLLVSQHPVTTEYGRNRAHIEETLAALQELKMPTIMLWPNADAGSDEISKGIRTFREKFDPDWLHLFINLPVREYVRLMARCACMVGNSSSAVREGAFIGTPAVDIGSRQDRRCRARNVVHADYHRDRIREAVQRQLYNGRYESVDLYGDGDAAPRIADILARRRPVIQKRITY